MYPAPLQDRINNFDFLRLSASGAVLISHQYALSGLPEPMFGIGSLGGIAVLVFFAISGYMVAGSWLNDPNFLRFVIRRLTRIWPGLIVATLLVTFVLGPWVSNLALPDYLASPTTWNYLKLLGLFEFTSDLPGVFLGNPVPQSANGSLWTIPIEVRCYGALAAVGLLGALHKKLAAVLLFVFVSVWFFFYFDVGYDNPIRMKLQMGIVFFSGALLFVLRNAWLPRRFSFALAMCALVVFLWRNGFQDIACSLGLPIAVIFLGCCATPVLRRCSRFGDLSYGVYIYAYPVQQSVVWVAHGRLSFEIAALVSLIVTAGLAALSWRFVEQPALQWKAQLRPHSTSLPSGSIGSS